MKTMQIKFLSVFIFCCLYCMSCDKEYHEGTILVNSEYVKAVDPVSLEERNYMQIKEIGNDQNLWMTVDHIVGFTYEEGYEYMLKVEIITKKKPQIDMSATTYKLIKILSKNKKSNNNK